MAAKNLNLIVCGVGGRMGTALVRAIQQHTGVKLVAGIDKTGSPRLGKDAGEIAAAGHLVNRGPGAAFGFFLRHAARA